MFLDNRIPIHQILSYCYCDEHNIVQGLISSIMTAAGMGTATRTVLPSTIVTAIEDCGFFESIPLWAVTLIGGLFITILSFINEAIAEIDESTGKIIAKAPGTVQISIIVKYGRYNRMTDSFTLTVKDAQVTINANGKDTLVVGEKTTLSAKVIADKAASQAVEWTSNNTAVATVNQNGVVTAIASGKVTIYATSKQYSYAIGSVSLEVVISPTKIIIAGTSGTLYSSKTKKLNVTVTPANASTDFIWSSVDSSVASVSEDGVITAKNIGTTKIIVKSEHNPLVKTEYTITVKNNVSYILYTSEWEVDAQKNRKDIADRFYGGDNNRVKLCCIRTGISFESVWNALDTYNGYKADIDYVVLDAHGSPGKLQFGIDSDDIKGFKVQNLKTLIILSCYAGFIDSMSNNVAYAFANITNGNPLIASDSKVIVENKQPYEDSKSLVYKSMDFEDGEDSENRETCGWLVYQNNDNDVCCYGHVFFDGSPKLRMTLFDMIEYIEEREYLKWRY